MPRGDGTGPGGMGPMTGRAAGYCAGYQVPGFANPVAGRGYGFGRGMGMGFRGGRGPRMGVPYAGYNPGFAGTAPYPAQVTEQQELESLQQQAEYITSTLEQINKRITELESKQSEK